MGSQPAKVQQMLRTYGRQLTNAKRLARFRRALQLSQPQDEVSITRQARRRAMVERIAREIVENLVVNGDGNPVVVEIMGRLEHDIGAPLLFDYPLDGGDVTVLRDSEHGPQEIVGEERVAVLRRLWEITLAKVDETML